MVGARARSCSRFSQVRDVVSMFSLKITHSIRPSLVSLQHIYLIAKTWTPKKHDSWTMRLNGFQFTYSVYLWLFIIRGKSLFMMIIFFKKSASGSYHLLRLIMQLLWLLCTCVPTKPLSPIVYYLPLSVVNGLAMECILKSNFDFNSIWVHLTPVFPSSSYRRPKDMNHKNKYIII